MLLVARFQRELWLHLEFLCVKVIADQTRDQGAFLVSPVDTISFKSPEVFGAKNDVHSFSLLIRSNHVASRFTQKCAFVNTTVC